MTMHEMVVFVRSSLHVEDVHPIRGSAHAGDGPEGRGVNDVSHGVDGGDRADHERAELERACAKAGLHAALRARELAHGRARPRTHAALFKAGFVTLNPIQRVAHREDAVHARGAHIRTAKGEVEQAA